jgi:gliding motility-associated-like protein
VVTDKNNCKGYDSLVITKIVNPPANFLPSDTSICTYGKLDLQSNAIFNNYAWNTGASSAVIIVASAGTYWLEIKDNNNCIGRDSIVVNSGDCMTGFYVPNAFTPGHDGKNDKFRPLVFGNVLQYEFTVYNRFGQIVFTTRQPGKGWDGTATQSSNAFAWTCRYQLENQPVKFEKGIVLLLK